MGCVDINKINFLMPHSLNNIWIHAVWATKYRQHIITPELETQLFPFIKIQFMEIGCKLEIINGLADHVHCLYRMNPTFSNANIIKQIKGSSTHFINSNNLTPEKFIWQTGYGAFSVSYKDVPMIKTYIKNQKKQQLNKHNIELQNYLKDNNYLDGKNFLDDA